MVGASGGEGVGLFRKIGGEEGASKSKVEDAGAPNEGHRKPSENTWDVKERKHQFRGPVKVGSRSGDLLFFEDPKGVCRGVVNAEVTQREGREGGHRKNNVRGDGAGIVRTTFRKVGVYDRETSPGGVEETVWGDEV